MTITLRSEKGSELTFTEMDDNFRAVREQDVSFFVSGGSSADETVWSMPVTRPMVLPAGLVDAQFVARAFTSGVFSISLNGSTDIGSIEVDGNTVTVTFAEDRELSPGDYIELVSDDAYTFDFFAATLRANLT